MLWLLLLLGVALLLAGGASLVKGATGIAEAYGIPPLVVGLTVVAFGTSAPELVVNLVGAVRGQTELAFGNIAGSNIANLALVLGTAAVITPIAIEGQIIKREIPLLMLATATLLLLTLDPLLRLVDVSLIDRSDALVLILLFGIFIYITVMDFANKNSDVLIDEMTAHPINIPTSKRNDWLFVLAGIVGLSIGGEFTIRYGSELALTLGMRPAIIGMVIVAVGTSMPELVTSVIAATRKEADLCVGNVIGSNLFNSLMALPLSALVTPVSVPNLGSLDIFVSLLLTIALVLIFLFGKAVMSRKTGLVFLAIYFGYITARVWVG
ncbi:MAG: cation:H+ antiporter [Candidatus Azotimanducaceae bacterium]|jgi:cation:H+ antiporter